MRNQFVTDATVGQVPRGLGAVAFLGAAASLLSGDGVHQRLQDHTAVLNLGLVVEHHPQPPHHHHAAQGRPVGDRDDP